jgi:hypothetical protein
MARHDPPPSNSAQPPRRVLILAAAPAQLLDIAGPAEVLAQAGRLRATEGGADGDLGGSAPLYDVAFHVVPSPGLPSTSVGLDLASTATERELLAGGADLDTLIVAGGRGRLLAAPRARGSGDIES